MKPSTKKVLGALRLNRPHKGGLTGMQLVAFTGEYDYRKRISELREMGYRIERTDTPKPGGNGKVSRYKLIFDVSKGK